MIISKNVPLTDSENPITLSVNPNGLKANTTILLNDVVLAKKEDSISHFSIGTNKSLKNAVVTVNTTVYKTPFSSQSKVDYLVEGAPEVLTETYSSPFVGSSIFNYSLVLKFE